MRPLSLFIAALFTLTALCTTSLCQAAEKTPLTTTIDADVETDYRTFIGKRDPLEIHTYNSRRDVIEVILLQQALALGGYPVELQLRSVDGYLDSLRVIARGDAVLRATPAWGSDSDKSLFYVSAPVIRPGEFQVGLYISPMRSIDQLTLPLSEYTAVTNHDLKADLHTLEQLGVHHIYNVERWPDMVSLVARGDADMILAPFQDTEGMEMEVDGKLLVPIPNVKVALADTRHWIVTRKHADSAKIFDALELGLKIQRREGTIVRAYTEAGFFHPKVKHWPLLNPVMTAATPAQ